LTPDAVASTAGLREFTTGWFKNFLHEYDSVRNTRDTGIINLKIDLFMNKWFIVRYAVSVKYDTVRYGKLLKKMPGKFHKKGKDFVFPL